MDWEVMRDAFPLLVRATSLTLQIFSAAIVLATALGLVVALMRMSKVRVFRWSATVFIWFFRATPNLVIIFFAYYLVGRQWLHLSALQSGILGLGVNAGAYKAEIIRSGIMAVDPGQWEAAAALGMSKRHFMRRVILPQAIRVMVPPYLSNTVLVLQATSLVAAIGLVELTGLARQLSNSTALPIELFTLAAVIYLAMSSVIVVAQTYLERRLALKT